jgi:hypothetical protein
VGLTVWQWVLTAGMLVLAVALLVFQLSAPANARYRRDTLARVAMQSGAQAAYQYAHERRWREARDWRDEANKERLGTGAPSTRRSG